MNDELMNEPTFLETVSAFLIMVLATLWMAFCYYRILLMISVDFKEYIPLTIKGGHIAVVVMLFYLHRSVRVTHSKTEGINLDRGYIKRYIAKYTEEALCLTGCYGLLALLSSIFTKFIL